MSDTPDSTPEERLRLAGGRCFLAGLRWVARFGNQQAVGSTEREAAEKLLEKLPDSFDNAES